MKKIEVDQETYDAIEEIQTDMEHETMGESVTELVEAYAERELMQAYLRETGITEDYKKWRSIR